MNEIEPTQKGDNGRAGNGRFVPGWRGGPGNPHARKVHKLRAVLLATVTPKDLERVIKLLVEKAQNGDVVAIKELLDRCLGKCGVPVEAEGGDKSVKFTLNIGPSPMRALPSDNSETEIREV